MKGDKNPFFGKSHSEETKRKMKENHSDFSGDNNPFKRSLQKPEKLVQHKHRCKKLWDNRDVNYRNKFSATLSKSITTLNNYNTNNHKSGHFIGVKCGRVNYRSSWEHHVMECLNMMHSIQSFSVEQLILEYKDQTVIRYTKPDILITLVNGKQILIEIKPTSLHTYGLNPKKLSCYRNYCKLQNINFILYDNSFHESETKLFETILEIYTVSTVDNYTVT